MELRKNQHVKVSDVYLFSDSLNQIIDGIDDDITYEKIKRMVKTLDPWIAGRVVMEVLARRDEELPEVYYQITDSEFLETYGPHRKKRKSTTVPPALQRN